MKEVYGEAVVPLAKDWAVAKSLELNAASAAPTIRCRAAVTTWKVGATYEPPIDGLRFRATARATSGPPTSASSSPARPGQHRPHQPPIPARPDGHGGLLSGNPNLSPRDRQDLDGRRLYQPGWLRGFRVAVDYYSITINNVIGQPTTQNIVDTCVSSAACLSTARSSSATRYQCSSPDRPAAYLDQARFKASGWDL